MKSIIVILFILTCACPDFSGLQAQVNLIRNGGFEEETTDTCGANSFTTNYCPIKYWYQHKGSSPEYFKSCSSAPQFGVPYNVNGHQLDASTGSSYAGIATYENGSPTFKEFLMTELVEPLLIGKQYKYTMNISRNDYYILASNIGISFENDSIIEDFMSYYTPTSTALVYQTDTTFKDCENWVKFEYVLSPAVAGLQHLVIGNFSSFGTRVDILPLTSYCGSTISPSPYDYAYYIIDDVSLYCLDCDTNITCAVALPDAFTPNADGLNDEWKPLINIDCIEEIDNYLLRIFNRWGEVVFTTHDKNEAWKGVNNEIGTYVYYLQYDVPTSFGKDKMQTKQGSVELIR